MKTISLVIPCYNEARGIPAMLGALETFMQDAPRYRFELVFVNDGSTDDTLARLLEVKKSRGGVAVVDLSRNFGKEAALSAGLAVATGDAVVPMDADLQDPPDVIHSMLALWEDGHEVVVAQRIDRSADSAMKRWTARWFYRIHNSLSDVAIPHDVGDFRLMDRAVVDAVKLLPENRRFMKGMFAWIGFRTVTVPYVRERRVSGKSSFNAWRLWNLAIEGITSFSLLPLRVWTYIGAALAFGALSWGGYVFARTIFLGKDVPGYASIMVAVLLLGGFQLIGIGIIGEYLGRTYMESKRRPPYVIRKVFASDEKVVTSTLPRPWRVKSRS